MTLGALNSGSEKKKQKQKRSVKQSFLYMVIDLTLDACRHCNQIYILNMQSEDKSLKNPNWQGGLPKVS